MKPETQNELLEPFLRKKRIDKVKYYIKEDSIVCDIGCGPHATFLKTISKKIKYGIGIDEKITPGKNENIELRNLKINDKLPVNDEEFDYVTLLAVIEHLDYPKEIMREAYRVLKKGGALIITTPAPRSKKLLNILARLMLISRFDMLYHRHYFAPSEMEDLLASIGFSQITTNDFEFGLNNLFIAQK